LNVRRRRPDSAFRANGEMGPRSRQIYSPNEFCTLVASKSQEGRGYQGGRDRHDGFVPSLTAAKASGASSRATRTAYAFDALLDDRIKLVTLMGKAGTGKTLMGHGCRLETHRAGPRIPPLVVARPTISMGKETRLPARFRLRKKTRGRGCSPFHDALEMLKRPEHGPRSIAAPPISCVPAASWWKP